MSFRKPLSYVIAMAAAIASPLAVGATTIRPVVYGPWGLLCTDSCHIRYLSDRHEIQWEVVLQKEGAQVQTWGRRKADCHDAQVTETIDRNDGPGQSNRNAQDVIEFAQRIVGVMRAQSDSFADCYNERGRSEPISPVILDEASAEFIRAFSIADDILRSAAIRAEAAQEAR